MNAKKLTHSEAQAAMMKPMHGSSNQSTAGEMQGQAHAMAGVTGAGSGDALRSYRFTVTMD